MCGCSLTDDHKTKVTVEPTATERLVFCCPHCAIMQLSLPEAGLPSDAKVELTDWNTGVSIAATSASVVEGSDVTPCCSPVLLAFADSASAEAFVKEHGGELTTWAESRAASKALRCDACPMGTDAKTAAHVFVGEEEKLACCWACAFSLLPEDAETPTRIEAACQGCGEKVIVDRADGELTASPQTMRLWFGTIQTETGEQAHGCHFSHWFHSLECLDEWRAAHPDEDGRPMELGEAIDIAAQKGRHADGSS